MLMRYFLMPIKNQFMINKERKDSNASNKDRGNSTLMKICSISSSEVEAEEEAVSSNTSSSTMVSNNNSSNSERTYLRTQTLSNWILTKSSSSTDVVKSGSYYSINGAMKRANNSEMNISCEQRKCTVLLRWEQLTAKKTRNFVKNLQFTKSLQSCFSKKATVMMENDTQAKLNGKLSQTLQQARCNHLFQS